MQLPENYVDNMKHLLGDDFDEYLESFNKESKTGLRVNTLKIDLDRFEQIFPYEVTKIPFIENGYYFSSESNPAKHPFYHAGLYYIQEPSAMLPANRLPVMEGEKVLDLCAAPGGKATELLRKLGGRGVLYANDISATRATALLKNLEMAGGKNFYVTAETPDKLALRLPEYFDKILTDVPCSGEGMFRKDKKLIASWVSHGPEYYSEIQKEIIEEAYKMLKPGGMMMYSTCTFSPVEDEENIKWFLEKHSDMLLCDIEMSEGFEKGLLGLDKCVRIYPHKVDGEGHFLALMKKAENNNAKTSLNYSNNIFDKPDIYVLPECDDNGYRKGLRYLRTGLQKYEENSKDRNKVITGNKADFKNKKNKEKNIKKSEDNNLKPAQSYAMSLKKSEYDNCLSFNLNDDRVVRYLKGETILLSSEEREALHEGYVLILIDEYPLGFGKLSGDLKLKNMYNPSWRMK